MNTRYSAPQAVAFCMSASGWFTVAPTRLSIDVAGIQWIMWKRYENTKKGQGRKEKVMVNLTPPKKPRGRRGPVWGYASAPP